MLYAVNIWHHQMLQLYCFSVSDILLLAHIRPSVCTHTCKYAALHGFIYLFGICILHVLINDCTSQDLRSLQNVCCWSYTAVTMWHEYILINIIPLSNDCKSYCSWFQLVEEISELVSSNKVISRSWTMNMSNPSMVLDTTWPLYLCYWPNTGLLIGPRMNPATVTYVMKIKTEPLILAQTEDSRMFV